MALRTQIWVGDIFLGGEGVEREWYLSMVAMNLLGSGVSIDGRVSFFWWFEIELMEVTLA